MAEDIEWCVVANVRADARSAKALPGSKHFSAGTKVLVLRTQGGLDRVEVLGRHRAGRLISVVMETGSLTNFRAKPIYSPSLIDRVRAAPWRDWNGEEETKRAASTLARYWVSPSPPSGERAYGWMQRVAVRRLDEAPRRLEIQAFGGDEPALAVLEDYLAEVGVSLPRTRLAKLLDKRRGLFDDAARRRRVQAAALFLDGEPALEAALNAAYARGDLRAAQQQGLDALAARGIVLSANELDNLVRWLRRQA
jgi:hypothetical protein